MPTTKREEVARLNMHLCLDTEVGRQYVNDRFTLLALIVGPPQMDSIYAGRNDPPRASFWAEFVSAFSQVFDISTGALTIQEANQWLDYYARWYREEEAKLK